MDQESLRLLNQRKIRDGRLPRDDIKKVWSSRSEGESCDGCDATISKDQMLMEGVTMDLGPEAPSVARPMFPGPGSRTARRLMDAEAIRDLIRTKLHADRLPRDSTPRAFGRPGNWQKCAACEETMAKALLMMEVYPLTKDKVVRFHGDCYKLWNEERRALKS